MRDRLGKVIAVLLLGVFALAVVVNGFAPQLPALLREGFPAPVWPPNGQTVLVSGVDDGGSETARPPPPAALDRFSESKGRALLVADSSGVIAEHYAPGLDRDTRLNSYSLVKTLISALVLRAMADGRIDSLDDRLPRYLGPQAPDVSLRAVLSMTAGLSLPGEPPKTDVSKPMDDAAFSPFSPVGRLHALGIEHLLPRLQVDPNLAGDFHYQSANTAVLGLMLERVYGQPLPVILSRLIWSPAGAQDAYWRSNPETGRASAYCCLYARPLDWVRVGRFLLENGRPGAPFLPQDLWSQLVMPDVPPDARREGHYGLHIRHDVLDRAGEALQGPFAYLMGHGGQVVYLLPRQDLVVVRFGGEPQLLHSTLYELFPD